VSDRVTIIGAGLAGSEAALQLAARGIRVRLLEQKPERRTPAQTSDTFCELVCSNSFRGAALSNAVGLLKQEMRWLGSFVMRAADATRVPAGGALAVDRDAFSETMTRWVRESSAIEVVTGTVEKLPDERPLLIATGPLTGDALAADIARTIGSDQLAYYDAIAPIITADSIDWSKVFMASRWDKGESEEEQQAYVNCPLDRAGYDAFVDALLAAQKVEPKSFEEVRYFEGCLPIEVMAERGRRTLAFGPMKPVGLTDPRTGRWPHAVVQLRSEDTVRYVACFTPLAVVSLSGDATTWALLAALLYPCARFGLLSMAGARPAGGSRGDMLVEPRPLTVLKLAPRRATKPGTTVDAELVALTLGPLTGYPLEGFAVAAGLHLLHTAVLFAGSVRAATEP